MPFCNTNPPDLLLHDFFTQQQSHISKVHTSGVLKRSPVALCFINAELPGMFRASTGTPNAMDCNLMQLQIVTVLQIKPSSNQVAVQDKD